MDIDALTAAVAQPGAASLGVALVAGFLFSFNPVALASIPVSLAYVTKARERRTALLFGAAFVIGILVSHAVLGAIAGLGGAWVRQLVGRYWGLVLGPALIVLGAVWPGWIRISLPALSLRATRVNTAWGAFVLGAAFSIAVCPACTPALVVLLGVAAATGSVAFGFGLLVAFAVGRAIPILLGASAMGWLETLKPLGRYRHAFEVAGGVILILAGLYMLNAYFFVIPGLAA
jgi:cytochrome c-type biogenesis protein